MGAIRNIPHPFPYQGSKRQLGSQIVECIPKGTRRLIEPFAGSGAVTISAAYLKRANKFWLNDLHEPLVRLWKAILQQPERLANLYERLWRKQKGREREFYDKVRERFNATQQPHLFLYLLARCVKAAVRYNTQGEFNNSPDNRRLGMRPESMRINILRTTELLRGRTRVSCRDYRCVLAEATSEDVVYMDPPYQGVCNTRDHRYCHGVPFREFAGSLQDLNDREIPYIVSYDGRTGDKIHGQTLPRALNLAHLEVVAGRSTQATLLGRQHTTVESLYLSPVLLDRLGGVPKVFAEEPGLFAAL